MTSNRTGVIRRTAIVTLLFILACQAVPTLAQTILSSNFEGEPASLPPSWTGLFGGAVGEPRFSSPMKTPSMAARASRSSTPGPTEASACVRSLFQSPMPGLLCDCAPAQRRHRLGHHLPGVLGTPAALHRTPHRGGQKPQRVGAHNGRSCSSRRCDPRNGAAVLIGPAVGSAYFDAVTIERLEPTAGPDEVAYAVTRQQIPAESIIALGQLIQWSQMGSSAQDGMPKETRPGTIRLPGRGTTGCTLSASRMVSCWASIRSPGGGGQSWAMVPMPNGDVYFTAGSTLFKFDQQESRVITLGGLTVIPGMIWDLETRSRWDSIRGHIPAGPDL